MKNIMRITMVAAFALFAGYYFYQSNNFHPNLLEVAAASKCQTQHHLHLNL